MTAAAGGAPSVAAVIDVGSNSVLLLTVADAGAGWRARDSALATTRLGAGLGPGGMLAPAARARTREAVVDFARRARATGAAEVWAFATGAARDAADGAAFTAEVAAVAAVPVEVLAGAREARLAYAAVAPLARGGPVLAMDVGGRTTELTLGRGEDILAAVSLPLGALALTDAHGGDTVAVAAAVSAVLAATDLPRRAAAAGAAVLASGGTATALAALDLGLEVYAPARVHGHVVRPAALAVALGAMSAAERARLPGLDPGRGAILPAGALVLAGVAAAAGCADVRVSEHGVRHAYLRERLAALGVDADFGALWT